MKQLLDEYGGVIITALVFFLLMTVMFATFFFGSKGILNATADQTSIAGDANPDHYALDKLQNADTLYNDIKQKAKFLP